MKTSELIGPALDWAVAKCEGVESFQWDWYCRTVAAEEIVENIPQCYGYSRYWSSGGPIIERKNISLNSPIGYGVRRSNKQGPLWEAQMQYSNDDSNEVQYNEETGPTPLVAAMRTYVASKLGDEIEIPQEMTK